MNCPNCSKNIESQKQMNTVLIEHCQYCGVLWVDFNHARPPIYSALEKQVERWEQRFQQDSREAQTASPHKRSAKSI